MAPSRIFGHQYTLNKFDENKDFVTREVIRLRLPAGATDADVYLPAAREQAPLVIVAHGFARHRHNMSGWGRHLAREGMVAVVPDLPSMSDHARNGRSLSELRNYLLGEEAWRKHIDPTRVGLMGFSAGGVASLLSAAYSPGVAIWIVPAVPGDSRGLHPDTGGHRDGILRGD